MPELHPFMLSFCEDNQLKPIGISYLGGIALFDPRVKTLSLQEKRCVASGIIGNTNQEVGEELHISEATVKTHLRRSSIKLGAETRAELLDSCLDPENGAMQLLRPIPARTIAFISGREKQIMTQIGLGQTNNAIARELALSPLTIKSHLEHITRKTGYGQRILMAAIAVMSGQTGKVPSQYPDAERLFAAYIHHITVNDAKVVRSFTKSSGQSSLSAPRLSSYPRSY